MSLIPALILALGILGVLLVRRETLAYCVVPLCLLIPADALVVNVGGVPITPLRAVIVAAAAHIAVRAHWSRTRSGGTALVVLAIVWLFTHGVALNLSNGRTGALSEFLAQAIDLTAVVAIVVIARPCSASRLRLARWTAIAITVNSSIVLFELATQHALLGSYYGQTISGFIVGRERYGLIRASGLLPHSIIAGVAAVVATVLLGTRLDSERLFRRRVLSNAAIAVNLAISILTLSRASWLAMAATVAITWAYSSQRSGTLRPYLLVSLAAGVLLVVPWLDDGVLPSNRLVQDREQEASIAYRIALLEAGIRAAVERPAGIGLGVLPRDSLVGVFQGRTSDLSRTIDNSFVWVLVRNGVAGLIVLVGAVILVGRRAIALLRTTDTRSVEARISIAALGLVVTLPFVALLSFPQGGLLTALVIGGLFMEPSPSRLDSGRWGEPLTQSTIPRSDRERKMRTVAALTPQGQPMRRL